MTPSAFLRTNDRLEMVTYYGQIIRNGRIHWLNSDVPAGWTVNTAVDINNSGTILATATAPGGTAPEPVLLIPTALMADINNDGVIDDKDALPTSAKPFRFWLNDDHDSGEEKTSDYQDVPLPDGDASRNCADTVVNGTRDLVDFFPVYLNLPKLLAVLSPGDGVTYRLKQGDEAVNVVFTDCTREEALDYLCLQPGDTSTGYGPTLAEPAASATVTKITAAGVDLAVASPAFLAGLQSEGDGVILVEASKVTTQPLVLSVMKNGTVLAEVSFPLKTASVNDMIHWYNLRSRAHGTPPAADKQGLHYGEIAPSDAPADLFPDAPNRKNVVFIHGYNVNGHEANGTVPEVFKRLYWSGSKARFYAVLWRGDDHNAIDFQLNVGHAWQQAPFVRQLLTNLPGDTVIIAHSLGNMVAQVALTHQADLQPTPEVQKAGRPPGVKNYFAIDAAVPLDALDGEAAWTQGPSGSGNSTPKELMRHPKWNGYDEWLWPADWYKLFPTTDARSQLTWVNIFAGLDIGTNFYSSGDELGANPVNDSIPTWSIAFDFEDHHFDNFGFRAWVAGQKVKGGQTGSPDPAEAVAIAFLRSSFNAGWAFNHYWYTGTEEHGGTDKVVRFPSEAHNVDAPAGVPVAELPVHPFFQPFQASEDGVYYPGYLGARLMAPIGDANASAEARKLSTVAKVLAEGIPSLSFVMASNPSTKFTQDLGKNFDLNTGFDPAQQLFGFKNGWPTSRSTNQNWRHGDYVAVAYTFIFPLFDRIVNDGHLK